MGKRKSIIIGANGYIARNLVYVMQRDYPDDEVAMCGIEPVSIDGYTEYTVVDMTDMNSVRKLDLNCDYIYMLVGRTGSVNGFDEYSSFIDINEIALLNLLTEYKNQKSCARIVFPSTRLVYRGLKGPRTEDAEKEFNTIYAINKYACEKYLEQFHRVYGVEYTIFRICVPYGTMIPNASSYGTAEFMLSKATKGEDISLYGDGSVRRTLTYIEDLCKSVIKGTMNERCANGVFNVGGEDYSLNEMAGMIAEKYHVGVKYIDWPDIALKIESGDTVFDSTKLDSIIDYNRKTKFADWIKNTVR